MRRSKSPLPPDAPPPPDPYAELLRLLREAAARTGPPTKAETDALWHAYLAVGIPTDPLST